MLLHDPRIRSMWNVVLYLPVISAILAKSGGSPGSVEEKDPGESFKVFFGARRRDDLLNHEAR